MWVIILFKKIALVLVLVLIIPINVYANDISAKSAIVIDSDSGVILYEKNAYTPRSMASTTKIMTALLAIESNRLEETVCISREMLNTEGSSLGLKVGDKISLYDLIVGMMLTSGNDSANAVACFVSGSIDSFADLMNQRGREIGMSSTCFVTPSGLDEGNHHSTAYDMALLTSVAVKNKTFCKIVSMQRADITISDKKVTVYNHNKLLSYDKDIFGVKTGYTEKAGRCLVSAKNYCNNKLICVTLSASDDWNDHLSLYDRCESRYNDYTVSGTIDIALVGASVDYIKASYSKQYKILTDMQLELYHLPFVYSPVKKGDVLGYVYVYSNGILKERLPIEADEDVEYYGRQERGTTSKIYG